MHNELLAAGFPAAVCILWGESLGRNWLYYNTLAILSGEPGETPTGFSPVLL
jgi:hypothetical protein